MLLLVMLAVVEIGGMHFESNEKEGKGYCLECVHFQAGLVAILWCENKK